jgi:hypothetical protein
MKSKREILRWRFMTAPAFCLLALWLLAFPLLAQSQPSSFNRDYDPYFRTYSATFLAGLLPGDDFRWFLAQCVQESGPRLDPLARSWADAVGVCQMTAGAMIDAGMSPDHRVLVKENIMGGAFILRRCIKMWWVRETREQRLKLGQACYNAGGGRILTAQVKCGGKLLWEEIEPCLHLVTGRHAKETRGYVKIIPTWYNRLLEHDQRRGYDYPVSSVP